jgi:hypothetical protein
MLDDFICGIVAIFVAIAEALVSLVLLVAGGIAQLIGSTWRPQRGNVLVKVGAFALVPFLIVGSVAAASWIHNMVDPPTLTERVVDKAVGLAIGAAIEYCADRSEKGADGKHC